METGVFVSFRGIDTRRTFVSHLLLSLSKEGFMFCKSEEEKPENEPASSQVIQAIQESKTAIMVISKNYTASVSCLDELTMLIEKNPLKVIPVFYEVDPCDVLRQAAEDFRDHGDGNNENLEKVKRWREALVKSIQIYHQYYSNWENEDSYSCVIDQVMVSVSFSSGKWTQYSLRVPYSLSVPNDEVSEVSSDLSKVSEVSEVSSDLSKVEIPVHSSVKRHKLILINTIEIVTTGIEIVRASLWMIARRFMDGEKPSIVKPRPAGSFVGVQRENYGIGNEVTRLIRTNDFDSFVGMDRHMKALNVLLDVHWKEGVGEIGIWGVEGVGKTTLASYVYEQISSQFQDHYYFMNGAKNYSLRHDSTCLLEEIARAALRSTSESESLQEVVKVKLGHRKVLLIFDNLFSYDLLESIRKFSRWFGPGSRLILVSPDTYPLVECEVKSLYEVESLRYDEALQLFSQFAFKQSHVPRGFERLSIRAVLITGRIPLSLRVFGSFLCGKCINEWESVLCRLEASQDNCVAKVSSYIGDAFS